MQPITATRAPGAAGAAGTPSHPARSLDVLLSRAEPLVYALMRVGFAIIIFTHGYPKIFGQALDRTVANIGTKLHLPVPWAFGYLVGALETVGMVLLAVGLATRWIGAMVFVEMLVISFGVLWPSWVWYEFGMEYPLLMALLALYLCVKGGGRCSVDGWRGAVRGGRHV